MVEGRLHNFSVGGFYNGVVLLVDDETRTYWDHMSGKALHGPLAGRQLDVWSIDLTTAGRLKADRPGARLILSRPGLFGRMFGWFGAGRMLRGSSVAPGYGLAIGQRDARLGPMEHGLGVIHEGKAKFYRLEDIRQTGVIRDKFGGRDLAVSIDQDSAIPSAEWLGGGRPLQLFTRWYGFSFSYPGCEIHSS